MYRTHVESNEMARFLSHKDHTNASAGYRNQPLQVCFKGKKLHTL